MKIRFLNRKAVKDALLSLAADKWKIPTKEQGIYRRKFTRVAGSTFEHLDNQVYELLREFIRQHPTVGKTLMVQERKTDNA